MTSSTDIIVVGGGPVGLTMGLILRYYGISVKVIDDTDGLVAHPRVGSVGVRSMEIFRRLGIKDDIHRSGWSADHPLDIRWTTALSGFEILRISHGTYNTRSPLAYSPEHEQICPHHWLSPILTRHLKSDIGTELMLNTRMEQFSQSDSRVEVNAVNLRDGYKTTISAYYLIACDGSHSQVREQCGLNFTSIQKDIVFQNILFEAPFLSEQLGNSRALVHFLISPKGLRYPLRSMDGKSLFRLTVRPEKGQSIDPEPPIRSALEIDTPFYVRSNDKWTLSQRVVENYRYGRVFFAGDAAHVMPPAGGFGMNTGIADTENLGWKIAAALKCGAGDQLLNTYNAERKPIALTAIEEANANVMRTLKRKIPAEICDHSSKGEQSRRYLREQLIQQNVKREFHAPDIHLGSYYASEPKSDVNNIKQMNLWKQQSHAGFRAPHVWLNEENTLSSLDLFGKDFVLLCIDARESFDEIKQETLNCKMPITIKAISVATAKNVYSHRYTLVRPDGFIYWQGGELSSRLFSELNTWCGLH